MFDLRRLGDTLLRSIQWMNHNKTAKPFSLAEVNLTETAVCWQYYATAEAARAEMEQRCAETAPAAGPMYATS